MKRILLLSVITLFVGVVSSCTEESITPQAGAPVMTQTVPW